MLVLARLHGEEFVIQTPDGDIWVRIIEIDRNRVRVGIDAPKEYPIYRKELLERMERHRKPDDDVPPKPAGGRP